MLALMARGASALFLLAFLAFLCFLSVGVRHESFAIGWVLFQLGIALDLLWQKHGSLEDFELWDVDYVGLVIRVFFSELLASMCRWLG